MTLEMVDPASRWMAGLGWEPRVPWLTEDPVPDLAGLPKRGVLHAR